MPLTFIDGFDYYQTATAALYGLTEEGVWTTPTSAIDFVSQGGKPGSRMRPNSVGNHLAPYLAAPNPTGDNALVVGILYRQGTTMTRPFRIGGDLVTSSNTTTANSNSVFALTTAAGSPSSVWGFAYNNVVYALPDWPVRFNQDLFVEVKITATSGTVRFNGITVGVINEAPIVNVTRMVFGTGSANQAWYDDLYVAYGENEDFYGPIKIIDAPNRAEVINDGYEPSATTVSTVLGQQATTSFAYTANIDANYVYSVTTNDTLAYLLHTTFRNVESFPATLQITQGEQSNNMITATTINLQNGFNSKQLLLIASDLVDQGDPVDGNGNFRYFGFRPSPG